MDEMDFSWRTQVLAYLLCAVMYQLSGICWAISYVRQLEFMLKKNKKLPLGEHLSIQDFVDRVPKHLLFKDGGARNMIVVGEYLVKHGVLLERQCPLTNSVKGKIHPDDKRERYRPASLYVHNMREYIAKYKDENLAYEKFHATLQRLIKNEGVVTVRIPVYESYSYLEGKDIFFPTDAEWRSPEPYDGHIMLGVGCSLVKDENGHLFYECQESYGTKICDEGYVRLYGDLITDFVEMGV